MKLANLFKIDRYILFLYLLLIILGIFNIYATEYDFNPINLVDAISSSEKPRYFLQMIWLLISLLIGILLLLLNPKIYIYFSYHIYGLMIIILLLVLFIGIDINGAKAWIKIGGIQLQPSEFAKPAICLALAKLISDLEFTFQKTKYIILSILAILLPVFLIVLENDIGSAIIFCSLFLVLYREGFSSLILVILLFLLISSFFTLMLGKLTMLIILLIISLLIFHLIQPIYKKLIIREVGILLFSALIFLLLRYLFFPKMQIYYCLLLSIIPLFIGYLIFIFYRKFNFGFIYTISFIIANIYIFFTEYAFSTFFKTYQQERIFQILGLKRESYNVLQSKIAIGSGGFLGKGYLKGTQTNLNMVPEQETDFIFCTIGEEWGLVGSFFIVILFIVLILRIIFLAERQESKFVRIYAYGVASILFFHFALNIGMVIGLLPVIGVPLPFFSYGGSSLLGFTILIFILLNLDKNRLYL